MLDHHRVGLDATTQEGAEVMFSQPDARTETLHHCHVMAERAWLFRSEDTQTTEDEYLQLLYALVHALKPISVLETGAFKGYGSCAIAKALRKNGTGKLTSLESVPKAAEWANEMLRVNGVADWAEIVNMDSIEYLEMTSRSFDFAFFDSQLLLRAEELKVCLRRNLLHAGDMFVMHDTSKLRTVSVGTPDPQTPMHWENFLAIPGIAHVQFPFSRGLTLGQVL